MALLSDVLLRLNLDLSTLIDLARNLSCVCGDSKIASLKSNRASICSNLQYLDQLGA